MFIAITFSKKEKTGIEIYKVVLRLLLKATSLIQIFEISFERTVPRLCLTYIIPGGYTTLVSSFYLLEDIKQQPK